MILTFFKGLLRELWLLVKDPRGIFMFLVAPLLMNIGGLRRLPERHCFNHIPLAAVEMSSSAKTREFVAPSMNPTVLMSPCPAGFG